MRKRWMNLVGSRGDDNSILKDPPQRETIPIPMMIVNMTVIMRIATQGEEGEAILKTDNDTTVVGEADIPVVADPPEAEVAQEVIVGPNTVM
jgi:hypothetical protein